MKYYKELANQKHKSNIQLQRTKKKGKSAYLKANAAKMKVFAADADLSTKQHIQFMLDVTKKLTQKNIYDFTESVDEQYKQKFLKKYF